MTRMASRTSCVLPAADLRNDAREVGIDALPRAKNLDMEHSLPQMCDYKPASQRNITREREVTREDMMVAEK